MFIPGEVAIARAAAACMVFWGSSGDVLVFRPYVDCYTCSYMSYRCFPCHQAAESRRLPSAVIPFAFISYMYDAFALIFFLVNSPFCCYLISEKNSLCTLDVQEKGCLGNIGTAG